MKLTYQPSLCIGCHLCELACSATKEAIFNPRLARLRVTSVYRADDLVNTAQLCDRCGQCMEVCPTGAISEGPYGMVLDESKCVMCGACIEACPTGVLRVGDGGRPLLCDGCQGDPACVKWCPHGALTTGEVKPQ